MDRAATTSHYLELGGSKKDIFSDKPDWVKSV